MSCRKCQEHRERIKAAAASGSIPRVTAETARALSTFNQKMLARFQFSKKAVAKRDG